MGVDIGGTFTDFVLLAEGGVPETGKVLTTPRDPSRAVLAGLRSLLAGRGLGLGDVALVVHGTTLATNAIIERKGARTALLTTKGFRDVLETGSEMRYDLYDLFIEFPLPLVPRPLRIGIKERTDYRGGVRQPVDPAEVERVVQTLLGEGVESLAICFLHSYANPENEERAGAAVMAVAPELPVSLSSRVLPEIGEYGRVSTTVANAYVQPLIAGYLGRIERDLAAEGFRGAFHVMTSNGGTVPAARARALPVRLIESGPAAGVQAALAWSRRLGRPDVVAFDMGGTTAKMCLVQDGRAFWTSEFEAARVSRFKKGSGLPIRIPALDLLEIGAGGGSIAHAGAMGILAVGPESAGAEPGPACYGLGGEEPTVTDADLVLGLLSPTSFLGGVMTLDRERAEAAIAKRVAEPLGLDPVEVAAGIVRVVTENMATAMAIYAAEKGVDLRRFELFAFGGAGPVHAPALAARVGIGEVVIPPSAGVLSALGCAIAPSSFDYAVSHKIALDAIDLARVSRMLEEMEAEGVAAVREAGLGAPVVHRSADFRYLGQRYEVNVPLPSRALGARDVPRLGEAFHRTYRAQYGRDIRDVPVEAVTFRVKVASPSRGLAALGSPPPLAGRPALKEHRPVWLARRRAVRSCPVYDRYVLRPGTRLEGPAIVEERESTTVVPPGARLRVDAALDLVITLPRRPGP
ncbi:MAG: hydantoinase/oxoprolinase family protein [Candidatus Rokubacteria bacterium]|nr:hydantoinase/oxoprolinase family protein [Candidatus Rokubacteria bacterium]